METTKSKQMRHDQWSFLPHELLHKIMEKLRYSDCIYAAATCKNWNIPVPTISRSFPWMANHDWFVVTGSNGGSQLCCKLNLYEAKNPKSFQPICRSFDLPGETGRFDIDGEARVKDSKLGWVLVELRIVKNSEKKKRSKSLLVLYNPFVQDFRFLPALEIPLRVQFAVFSRPPTSSNCVVYAISRNRDRRSFRVDSRRWCNDQMTWTVSSSNYDYSVITNANIPRPKFRTVVAMEDGTLYCLELNVGSLIAFKNSSDSIQAQTMSFELPVDDDDDDDLVIMDGHMTEHEGELLLVSAYKIRPCSLRYHRIYRYDKSANCWIRKQGLDHQIVMYYSEFYNFKSAAVIGRIPGGLPIVYLWRMRIDPGGLLFVPLQEEEEEEEEEEEQQGEEELSNVPLKLIFPSYDPNSCGVRVRLLSMGP